MNFKSIIISLLLLVCFICSSFEIHEEKIDYDGVYVARDTLVSIDKNFKNEITVSLLKFNRNQTVQSSFKYTYLQGESDNLNNATLLKWLHHFSSYTFALNGNRKLKISCYSKHKTVWNDFATPTKTIVEESFKIKGDTLFRSKRISKHFRKMYILNRDLTTNHPKIKQGNACSKSRL